MLFKSEKHRWRSVILHTIAFCFILILGYPIMGASFLLQQSTGVDRSVTSLLGGGILSGISYLIAFLIGKIAFPRYFRGE
jgi:hypothetical protein